LSINFSLSLSLVDVPKQACTFVNRDDKKLTSEMRRKYNGLDLSSNLKTLLKEASKHKHHAEALRIESRTSDDQNHASNWCMYGAAVKASRAAA
jgi:formylmethanofuran dehydrogenase subunit E